MKRAHVPFAGTLATVMLGAGLLAAGQATQAPPKAGQAPPMKQVLAGKKLIPPARGVVIVEYTMPSSRRTKDAIVTTMLVKNIGSAPIARLQVNETWFSDAGAVVSGNKGVIDGLLQPGEVKTLTIETPFKPGMSRSSMKFSHANGEVKERRVAKLVLTAPK